MPRLDHPPGFVWPETHTRRTVLEWLGAASVLALGSPLLSACAGAAGTRSTGDPPRDSGGTGLGFSPGSEEGALYDDWPVRTVDQQDPASLLASWRLTVDGLVDTPTTFTFGDLLALPRQDQVTDFHCVEGWSVMEVPWNGVHLSTILARTGASPKATHVTFHTVRSVYNESLPLAVALEARSMLGFGVAGSTLPLNHGFPLRLVVPRLLAYKNPKYVERIELTDRAVEGYWVQRGYGYDGEVPRSRLREGYY